MRTQVASERDRPAVETKTPTILWTSFPCVCPKPVTVADLRILESPVRFYKNDGINLKKAAKLLTRDSGNLKNAFIEVGMHCASEGLAG
jgi:hypothetical protein